MGDGSSWADSAISQHCFTPGRDLVPGFGQDCPGSMLQLNRVSYCSLGANDTGVMCRVWQWRIVAVVEKAVPPAAVADKKQGCQKY